MRVISYWLLVIGSWSLGVGLRPTTQNKNKSVSRVLYPDQGQDPYHLSGRILTDTIKRSTRPDETGGVTRGS